MNINYLMGLCAVAGIVNATIQFIVWLAATYPVTLIVAVVAVVAAWVYAWYGDYKRRVNADLKNTQHND